MDVTAESGLEVGVGTGVKMLNTGVATPSVNPGEEPPEGVDACSVANRSGVGEVDGVTRPHPSIRKRAAVIQRYLVFFIFEFDGFKIEFLTR
jgi:hypothetical protein